MSIFDRLARHFRGNGTTPPQQPEIVTTGIIRVVDYWLLTSLDDDSRGVKVVSIPASFEKRYFTALDSWYAIQVELDALQKSLRPRRKKERTEIPE